MERITARKMKISKTMGKRLSEKYKNGKKNLRNENKKKHKKNKSILN